MIVVAGGAPLNQTTPIEAMAGAPRISDEVGNRKASGAPLNRILNLGGPSFAVGAKGGALSLAYFVTHRSPL